MNSGFDLNTWNYQVLMLVQAMIGAITPNFRMVVLSLDGDEWVLTFYLETNAEDDIEEVDDIVCQYTAYQDSRLKSRYEVVVSDKKLPHLLSSERVVFRRKEFVGE
ncbi:hypothetical protein [Pseudomonas sp. MWU13-2105]|uniref:hypothetical protein n=1 Tax=Pseudomonas sp. MWU13-2105 TaxID=2935074 RepID=UPI00200D7662|nr:hypothetical protein [Pseudomonas sp. MWU13-2105]